MRQIDQTWSLFLDRDGVINKKLDGDYVKHIEEFEFIEGSIEAIRKLSLAFGRSFVVTNQQGIGKGLMTTQDLQLVHHYMLNEIEAAGGKLDKVYFCPDLAEKNTICRKPNTGMAEEARSDFPKVNFKKSYMVGDSISDLQMGKRLGMKTVYIHEEERKPKEADYVFSSLEKFSEALLNH